MATHSSGTRFGPYEVLSLLGEGGMGQVYRARDPRLGREIAIKVLPLESSSNADALARFEREARAVASLSHPNILAVHDFGSEHGTFYVVTELLEGETLRKRLELNTIEWRRSIEIGAEISEALAAAHARGVVHRDLKPENIFLTTDGRVKILDFGLAQTDPLCDPSADTAVTAPFRTDPGPILGTLGYMAPEQLRGEPVSGSADIFSLGCILYEMVTAKKPFQRESGAATIAAILKEDIPKDSLGDAAPPELQRVIEGCVEKSAQQRFQSARDLALTLRAISSSTSMPEALLRRMRKPRKSTIDSIAVLPLENVGDDPESEYLSDGITEGVINRLSQLPKLKVMARSTVFRYKHRDALHPMDAQAVGRDLRVRAVMSGRLQRLGDRVVINVELVDAQDGSQLWAEHYNRQISDVERLQESMSTE